MVKDIKYIIKRIIIVTGIAIALMCIKGNFLLQGHALQAISSWQMTAQDSQIDTDTNSVAWYTNTSVFANQGDGELIFTFSLNKITGESTTPVLSPRFVRAHTGGDSYVCYIGSSTLNNSTHTEGVYSAICPMHLGSAGLTSIVVAFQDVPVVNKSLYRVRFNGLFTWKRDTEYTLLDAINNKLNNLGNSDIINNQNSNTQNIIDNQDSNTQDVINNQNSNTQQQIESQKVCKNYDKVSIVNDDKFLMLNGSFWSNTSWGVTDYLDVSNSEVKIITNYSGSVSSHLCFYDDSKNLISCTLLSSLPNNTNITFPTGTFYIRTSINKSFNLPQFIICKNGNQAIVDSQQDINNTLNDDSGGEVSSSWFDEFRESSSTPVSDLLTMPITLLQAYLNGFSDTCRDMNLGALYGTYIIIPCLNIESYLGSELWSLIDVLFTLFMIYNIGMLCVTIYEGITSLNDDMQFLYSPRHAGAGDTRVERYGDDY